jgi:hypothetical protein
MTANRSQQQPTRQTISTVWEKQWQRDGYERHTWYPQPVLDQEYFPARSGSYAQGAGKEFQEREETRW